jgi:uncharacterized protein
MKIALFGAGGMIGSRIAQEALARGHEVTAVSRDPARLALKHAKFHAVQGDVLDPASITAAVLGQGAVISAFGPGHHGEPQDIVRAAKALVAGVRPAGVKRLLVVGGAGGLEVKPGLQLVDTPEFPAAWKPVALAHRDALAVYRGADLDWTYLAPAALIQPGTRTGSYRTAADTLLTDAKGESRISAEDYAVAMLDELEHPKHLRARFTAAY